jgi:hypothetical protein
MESKSKNEMKYEMRSKKKNNAYQKQQTGCVETSKRSVVVVVVVTIYIHTGI